MDLIERNSKNKNTVTNRFEKKEVAANRK